MSMTSAQSTTVVWTGRPWITPDAIARTILVIIVGAVIIWLENLDNVASSNILGFAVWLWTALIFSLIWVASLIPLVGLSIAHRYTLHGGSLEVKTGIASLQTFVLSPSGFSDLEIDQGITGRIFDFGDIIIHTQSERTAKMQKVRNPNRVASQIRDYMGRPIVRLEGQPAVQTK